MIITYHGGQCFKVSFGDTTLAFDPISKKSDLPPVKFGSDVAFITMHHPNFNGADQVAHGSREPFVVEVVVAITAGAEVALEDATSAARSIV